MKIQTKIILANSIIMLTLITSLIAFFPIVRTLYINDEVDKLRDTLIFYTETSQPLSELLDRSEERGYSTSIFDNPDILDNLLEDESQFTIIDFKQDGERNFVVYSESNTITDDNDFITEIRVEINEQALNSFLDAISPVIIIASIIFLIFDLLFLYFTISKIVIPIGNIEKKLIELKHFNFNKKLLISTNDEFQVLAETINSLNDTLEHYVESRQGFARSLSHELKTPVTVIQSVIELYDQKIEPYDNYDYSKQLIEENLARILDASQLSLSIFTSKSLMELKEINVTEIIKSELDLWKPSIKEKKINLDINLEDINFYTDLGVFKLITSTVLQNIAKYAKHDTVVEIYSKDNKIYFSNEISDNKSNSTQVGLSIAKTLGSNSNILIENNLLPEKNRYLVIVSELENDIFKK